jgi:hypothetical protein
MSQARTTELLEGQSPGKGIAIVPWDNSDTPCVAFHANAAGKIDVEMRDGSTGSLQVLAGVSYGYHILSFKDTGDTPEIYYFGDI